MKRSIKKNRKKQNDFNSDDSNSDFSDSFSEKDLHSDSDDESISEKNIDTQKKKSRYNKEDEDEDDFDEDNNNNNNNNNKSEYKLKKLNQNKSKTANKSLTDIDYLLKKHHLSKYIDPITEEEKEEEEELKRKKTLALKQLEESQKEHLKIKEKIVKQISNKKTTKDDVISKNINKKHNYIKNTTILPPKLKSVCPTNLKKIEENYKIMENVKRNDIIYNIMTNNSEEGLEILSEYVKLFYEIIKQECGYPFLSDDDSHAQVWDKGFSILSQTNNVGWKRAFIWSTLLLSTTAVEKICPKSEKPYLTNPQKLSDFVFKKDSPLITYYSDLILPHFDDTSDVSDMNAFASSVTVEWIKLFPWDQSEVWQKINPMQTSTELKKHQEKYFIEGVTNLEDDTLIKFK
jgi:hypothetical protein